MACATPPASRRVRIRTPAAERMFIDLVGSTAIGQRLDPEDLARPSATFHAHVTGLVAGFNGFIARYMGDGVLVYFGYPQAA